LALNTESSFLNTILSLFVTKDDVLYKFKFKYKKMKNRITAKNINNILICGMGASAISGNIAKNLIKNKISLPFLINKDVNLPNWVNKNTLCLIISHSGNTQETIKMAKKAIKIKAKIIIITSDGELGQLAKKENTPILKFPFKKPSRFNIGFSLTFLSLILKKLNLVSSLNLSASVPKLIEINKMFDLSVKTEENVAKHLAYFIFDHLPVITSTHNLNGITQRLKNQLSENSKNFSYLEEIPEIIHNSIENKNPWRLKDEIVFLIFENLKKDNQIEKTIKTLTNILDKKNIRWQKIPIFAKAETTKILSLVCLMDWISYYLAILNKIDPASIKEIEKAKKQIYE